MDLIIERALTCFLRFLVTFVMAVFVLGMLVVLFAHWRGLSWWDEGFVYLYTGILLLATIGISTSFGLIIVHLWRWFRSWME